MTFFRADKNNPSLILIRFNSRSCFFVGLLVLFFRLLHRGLRGVFLLFCFVIDFFVSVSPREVVLKNKTKK